MIHAGTAATNSQWVFQTSADVTLLLLLHRAALHSRFTSTSHYWFTTSKVVSTKPLASGPANRAVSGLPTVHAGTCHDLAATNNSTSG
jgi:hypothetical protein